MNKPIFELRISGLTEAMNIAAYWATHTVSLIDPGDSRVVVAGEGARICRLNFHDVTPMTRSLQATEFSEPTLAASADIELILEFTESLAPQDRLLVHCHAGISRSTAVACGILCQHGLAPREAVNFVLSVRPEAAPNAYILKLFDAVLELDGGLFAAGGAYSLLPP